MMTQEVRIEIRLITEPDHPQHGEKPIPRVAIRFINAQDLRYDEYRLPLSVAHDVAQKLQLSVQDVLMEFATQLPVRVASSEAGRG